MSPDRLPPAGQARGRDRKEIDMASKKKNASKAEAAKPPRKKLGEVALVLRVPKEAVAYIDQRAGDRPRTAFVRDVLAKGDAALGKILGGE
jgi:hypothetical protein